jgi:SAM-dependent methyltransferase
MSNSTGTRPDSDLSNKRYNRLATTFDRRNAVVFTQLRAEAARLLDLQPGDHALEAGSGTGANFANLVAAVGPTGRVTGIEMSEGMASQAKERIAKQGWDNVEVRVGPAASTPPPEGVDGILFFMTHDILRTPEAVTNILSAGKPGARVVSFGPKAAPKWNFPIRAVVMSKARGYHTTFEGFDKPWSPHLESRLVDFKVKGKMLGGSYMAWGRLPG